ncbi:PepSY domain-containing protein [Shewanella maritima]|uniref:PepSY domain-containing protein n=1 Tax=Shewanella maritima TaxID=2520507 RepID=A0A411PGX4_9GAMM|nr:PepSY-associated TM helix domain-containing protein [Shewanella maritima]QBF82758.1 PepSY domain-containing protein [Shewanella maritima]
MRKTLFKWHSYAALVAMLPIFIISITGSILVFKVEIDSLLRPEHMRVDHVGAQPRVSLDTLMTNVLDTHTGYELGGWELFHDNYRSDAGYLIKHGTEEWSKIYVNQYTGELLSQPQTMEHYITDWLLELHYTFLLHNQGIVVGFIVALVMLFLGVSGIIIYRRFWAKFFTLRYKAVRRILFSDIHKMIGIVSSPVLIILAITGGYWNISLLLHEYVEHAGKEHFLITEPLHSETISFETLRLQARQEIDGFSAGYLSMPHEPDSYITYWGDVPNKNPFSSEYSSTVTFDKDEGKLVSKIDVRESGFSHVFVDSFRKLHFGYFGGLVTRIIWCVLGLMPVVLAFTGFYLYWQRTRQRKRAKVSRQELQVS